MGRLANGQPGPEICQCYNEKHPLMAGTLFVVATPIGNLEDVTARALRILRDVELIAAEDTRRTAHLLARYGITTRTTSLHEHNEHTKSSSLIERLKAGESIALVSDAGTPTVSDPGRHLIAGALAADIRVEPIPGPSAALAALSASGLATESFSFLGFPPNKTDERVRWFERLQHSGPTVVFFEAPHRIRWTLEELQRIVGDVHVVLAREITKKHEQFLRGPISAVLSHVVSPVGEFTVIVDVGLMANHAVAKEPTANSVFVEFCDLTNIDGFTRRRAISTLSRKHRLSAKRVYEMIEACKK